jgi:hypothetical protein
MYDALLQGCFLVIEGQVSTMMQAALITAYRKSCKQKT